MDTSTAKIPDDRQQEIKHALKLEVSDMLAAANEAGYGTSETLEALEGVLEEQKTALAEDPDPAEDPS